MGPLDEEMKKERVSYQLSTVNNCAKMGGRRIKRDIIGPISNLHPPKSPMRSETGSSASPRLEEDISALPGFRAKVLTLSPKPRKLFVDLTVSPNQHILCSAKLPLPVNIPLAPEVTDEASIF